MSEGRRGKKKKKESAPEAGHLNVAGPCVLGIESVKGVVEDETELVGRESVEGGDTAPTEKGGEGEAYEET